MSTGIPCSAPGSSSQVYEHEVQRGDWLYDICRRHNVDLRSLMIANPSLRNPNDLVVGSRIKILGSQCPPAPMQHSSPVVAELRPVVNGPRATTKIVGMEGRPSSIKAGAPDSAQMFHIGKVFVFLGQVLGKKHREYKVREGDTLEWLAAKFGTSVKAIKTLNRLQSDLICTGSILKIERSLAFEQQNILGRKATVQERVASELGHRIDSSMATFMSASPMFRVCVPLQKTRKQKPSPQIVRVQSGDTLAGIASANGLSIRELQRLNHLRDDTIFEGDVLAVTPGPTKTEVLELRAGRRRTNRPLFSRQIHGGGIGIGGPHTSPRSKSTIGNGGGEGRWKRKKKGFQPQERWMRFKSPVTAGFVSSPYGWRWGAFHEGVDLAADQGAPILASDKGTVTFAGWNGGYGYLIAIQHEGGFLTRYAHCCAIHARVGQQVSQGQHVAAVGSTGHATGPHLHFEVRRNGESLDPFKWVNL